MQSVSSRIWTCVAVSISYDDNHYTMAPPVSIYFRLNVLIIEHDHNKWSNAEYEYRFHDKACINSTLYTVLGINKDLYSLEYIIFQIPSCDILFHALFLLFCVYGFLPPISQSIQVRWIEMLSTTGEGQTHKQHSLMDSYTWTC